MTRYWRISLFRIRHSAVVNAIRRIYWRAAGMKIGVGTRISSMHVTWPHCVVIGNDCVLEHEVVFKVDGPYTSDPLVKIGDRVFIGGNTEFNIRAHIAIGNDTLIASGCRFIDHDHGLSGSQTIRTQCQEELPISIGKDCWIGANAIVLKGVIVGDGAVIGAGTLVNVQVPPAQIWAGIPARCIGHRT